MRASSGRCAGSVLGRGRGDDRDAADAGAAQRERKGAAALAAADDQHVVVEAVTLRDPVLGRRPQQAQRFAGSLIGIAHISGNAPVKGLVEVGQQVLRVFEAHMQPHHRRAVLPCAVLAQSFGCGDQREALVAAP